MAWGFESPLPQFYPFCIETSFANEESLINPFHLLDMLLSKKGRISSLLFFALVLCFQACSSIPTQRLGPTAFDKSTPLPTWLSDPYDPRLLSYAAAENEYRIKQSTSWQRLAWELQDDISRIQNDLPALESPGLKHGNFVYNIFYLPGSSQPIIHRKNLSAPDDSPEVILDIDSLFDGYPKPVLQSFRPSQDGNWIALTLASSDPRDQGLFLFQHTQKYLRKLSEAAVHEFEWGPNDTSIYFTTLDNSRPAKLFRSNRNDQSFPSLVYAEEDAAFFLKLRRSLSQRLLFLESNSIVTSEVRFIGGPDKINLFSRRKENVSYFLEDSGAGLYVRTNEDAPNFKILNCVRPNTPKKCAVFLAESKNSARQEFFSFKDFVIILEQCDGQLKPVAYDHQGLKLAEIDLPTTPFSLKHPPNQDWSSREFVFKISSPGSAPKLINYNPFEPTSSRNLFPQDADNSSQTIWANSPDGTKVPIIIFRGRQNLHKLNPVILHGYGAYGQMMNLEFSAARKALLDRGIILAFAEVRGGGYGGPSWHAEGRGLKKARSVQDFIAAAKRLQQESDIDPSRIVAFGRSAGGWLVATSLLQEPNLFSAAALEFPFLNVLGNLLNEHAPLAKRDRLEWGDPTLAANRKFIANYDPMQLPVPDILPRILLRHSLKDQIIPETEALLWLARLRQLAPAKSNAQIYLDTSWSASHAGEADESGESQAQARLLAFLLTE